MNVSLADCLKKLDLTLHLSLDSVSVAPSPTRVESAAGPNVNYLGGRDFNVHIDASGDCLIWAKWYGSLKADGSDVTPGKNPLFDDGGNSIYAGAKPADLFDKTITLPTNFSDLVVHLWALDKNSDTFSPGNALGHCPSSSSSSSSSDSSTSSANSSSSSSDSSLSSANSSISSSSSANTPASSTSTVSSSSAKIQAGPQRRR